MALHQCGWRQWYDERLCFQHFIPKSRLKWTYLRNMYRAFGRASADLRPYEQDICPPQAPWKTKIAATNSWQVYALLRHFLRNWRTAVRALCSPMEGQERALACEMAYGRLVRTLQLWPTRRTRRRPVVVQAPKTT
jgi:hypothetical protein